MEIQEYNNIYLNDSMKNLAEAFDYVSNDLKMDLDDFMDLFISTGYADRFNKLEPKVVSGLSGVELVLKVLKEVNINIDFPSPSITYDCSDDYWAGWVLSYYQFKTNKSFKYIHSYVSMKDIVKMYHPLHEASEDKFVDNLTAYINKLECMTRLQLQRKRRGLSQKELSNLSGINLRTLQQYESKSKDINKAAVKSVISLSNVLGCSVEDILE